MPNATRDERRAGRVGREAGSEAGDGFLENEKRTGKSACATQSDECRLIPEFNSKELAECRRFTRDERRAGRVGREAGGEAGDGSLENEKRTGKSACATQGENRKSCQDAGVLRASFLVNF
jgi:hypothetical protein